MNCWTEHEQIVGVWPLDINPLPWMGLLRLVQAIFFLVWHTIFKKIFNEKKRWLKERDKSAVKTEQERTAGNNLNIFKWNEELFWPHQKPEKTF